MHNGVEACSSSRSGRSFYVGFLLFLGSLTVLSIAQTSSNTAEQSSPQLASQSDTQHADTDNKAVHVPSTRGAWVAVPVPMSSPAIGSGVTVMAGYITPLQKKDTVSPASVFGMGGLFTDNGTRGLAAGAELYFRQNRYHVIGGYAQSRLNYQFYGTGTVAGDAGRKFGLKQDVSAFFAEGTRRMWWRFFAGPRILWGTSTLASQRQSERFPNLPPLNVGFDLRSLGGKIERDTRINRFYPAQGSSIQISADFFDALLGSTFTFQTYRLTFSAYQSLGAKQVLAYNVYLCMTGGRAPFFGQCIFGTDNELRGYVAGRYIDRDMAATQIEYRLSLPKRAGVVVFAGLGEVGPQFGGFNYNHQLPCTGIGPRFQLSKQYHVNLRADFAQGKNERTFSMGLGEAF